MTNYQEMEMPESETVMSIIFWPPFVLCLSFVRVYFSVFMSWNWKNVKKSEICGVIDQIRFDVDHFQTSFHVGFALYKELLFWFYETVLKKDKKRGRGDCLPVK